MKLWLVCFLVLFFGAEAAQWLGQVPWISHVELSLPLTVVGGIGLAIASNYRSRPTFGPPSPQPAPPPLTNPTPPPSPAIKAPVQPIQTRSKGDTISFEIKKPPRKV
ncbi:hypothetical protein [Nodosilinea sp. E11]|uniref:hypothetical protein n=1 Tax=Nodosilinea sp. E11 TaxID=3037479 RepID=UPI0029349692|nr:hypothetical protein [Nodosilinea sp. E11]WOD37487.1 hypothetical protein RRF56_14860 [Nodosilinea sp. E11]